MCVSGFLTGALNCALQALHAILPRSAGNTISMFLSDEHVADIHITHTIHIGKCLAVVTISRPSAAWCARFMHAVVPRSEPARAGAHLKCTRTC